MFDVISSLYVCLYDIYINLIYATLGIIYSKTLAFRTLKKFQFTTYRSIFRRNKQSRSLRQHSRRLSWLRQRLNPSRDPRLAALHFGRLGLEHDEAVRFRRLAVVDDEVGRHGNVVRQRLDARPRQTLVQDRRQQTAVDDARVAADVPAEVHDDGHLAARVVGPGDGRDGHLVGSHEGACREAARPVLGWVFQVRSRFGEVGALADFADKGVVLDGLLDPGGLIVVGLEPREALLVRVEGDAPGLEVLEGADGADAGKRGAEEGPCEGLAEGT